MSKKDWILQTKEIRRSLNNATWIPLRASQNSIHGNIKKSDTSKITSGAVQLLFLKSI